MMNYLSIPFRVVYKIYYLIVFVLSLSVTYPIMYFLLSDPKRFQKAFIAIRIHAFLLLFFSGTRMKISGLENIPKSGSFIICPNHTSYLDIFCVYYIFKKYFVFTGKKEIEKWPLFHIYYTSGMNILVDRHSKTGSFKAFKRMSNEIEKGRSIAIFPEGTISKSAPKLAPFKSGAFSIAILKKVPVLPITFVSNWKILQRGSFWMGKCGPGISRVVIHKAITTKGFKKEDVDKLKNQVQKTIEESLI